MLHDMATHRMQIQVTFPLILPRTVSFAKVTLNASESMAGYRFNIHMRHLESDIAVSVQNGFSGGNVMQVAIKSICVAG
jgi:hypothetical protein